MSRENARVLLENRVQKLLLEYISCWEQYCSTLTDQSSISPSLQQLDKFIAILQTLRELLQTIDKEAGLRQAINLDHHEKKNNRKRIK